MLTKFSPIFNPIKWVACVPMVLFTHDDITKCEHPDLNIGLNFGTCEQNINTGLMKISCSKDRKKVKVKQVVFLFSGKVIKGDINILNQ